jgi:hypothetical protein
LAEELAFSAEELVFLAEAQVPWAEEERREFLAAAQGPLSGKKEALTAVPVLWKAGVMAERGACLRAGESEAGRGSPSEAGKRLKGAAGAMGGGHLKAAGAMEGPEVCLRGERAAFSA